MCKREGVGMRLYTTAMEFWEVMGHNSLPLAVTMLYSQTFAVFGHHELRKALY